MNTIEALQGTLTATTDAAPARTTLRSVGAVLAGLLSTVVVTTAVDMALHASGVFPPHGERMSDALFVLALAYRILFNTAGCHVAARLAPARPTRHYWTRFHPTRPPTRPCSHPPSPAAERTAI